MAEIELLEDRFPDLLPMAGRSEGLHVSEIIHRIAVGRGLYQDRDEEGGLPSDVVAKMQLGQAWEDAIAGRLCEHYPKSYVRGYEIEADGVFGTFDAVYISRETGVVPEEVKCTWKSYRRVRQEGAESESLWTYRVQLKAYARMMGAREGRLRVVFVNGDYEHPYRPIHRLWHFKWREEELVRNWKMLMKTGEGMR